MAGRIYFLWPKTSKEPIKHRKTHFHKEWIWPSIYGSTFRLHTRLHEQRERSNGKVVQISGTELFSSSWTDHDVLGWWDEWFLSSWREKTSCVLVAFAHTKFPVWAKLQWLITSVLYTTLHDARIKKSKRLNENPRTTHSTTAIITTVYT